MASANARSCALKGRSLDTLARSIALSMARLHHHSILGVTSDARGEHARIDSASLEMSRVEVHSLGRDGDRVGLPSKLLFCFLF